MYFKERVTTPKGKMNANWKRILDKEPHWLIEFDAISDVYDLKTKAILLFNGLTSMPACKTCSNDVKVVTNAYCSAKCSANDPTVKAKQVANTDIKAKNKKISEGNKGKGCAEKAWVTRKEKYGTSGLSETGIQSYKDNGHKRIAGMKKTCIEKYGTDNFASTQEFKEWARKNQLEAKSARNHIADWVFDKEQFIEMFNMHNTDIMSIGNFKTDLFNRLCIEYGIREKHQTLAEAEIQDYIETFGLDYMTNTRTIIKPLELDIYIPEKKLAIEFNGLYWHSSNSVSTDNEYKTKHLHKTEECEKLGITLLQIFENEWVCPNKREIWKSVIRNKLGRSDTIYARKCKIEDISNSVANDFCKNNHLQGSANCSFARGLFYNNELVMVATFGKSRFNKDELELIRLCSAKGITVTGGASKITKGLEFISFANRRWSSGNVYNKMGLTVVNTTPPNYWYYNSNTYEISSRQQYMKHKLEQKLKHFDSSLTEVQNCYNNGLRRFWDCGNIKFTNQVDLKSAL